MFKRAFNTLTSTFPSPASHRSAVLSIMPHMTEMTSPTRHILPSVMMRSGTSKGLFLHRHHLPPSQEEWGPVLLSVMGSRDGDRKQLDGVGGGTSTTSKVAIVSPSSRPDADVEYTFAQVAIGKQAVDFSGNCGNMACGVGPFALDEGLVQAKAGQSHVAVRVYNTNTQRLLIETVQVSQDGTFNEFGNYKIGGVRSEGSEIGVAFVEPAGSMTGRLLPTGTAEDLITVSTLPALGQFTVTASLVDAANPFIFIDSVTLPSAYHLLGPSAPESIEIIEAIRQAGAVMCGLAKDTASAALVRGTPKIAVLSRLPGIALARSSSSSKNIQVQSYSMGNPHPSFQLTGAVCLGAAMCVDGTVANRLATTEVALTPPGTPPVEEFVSCLGGEHRKTQKVCIRHGSGEIEVLVETGVDGFGETDIKQCSVSRTARRLFKGEAYYNI